MPTIVLDPGNKSQLAQQMKDDTWVVACLCAAWCDVCNSYRSGFDTLANEHPDKLFVWIDIEDRADLVGDFDVENFPTLLLQHGDDVVFYGTSLPDPRIAHRLLMAHADKTDDERRMETRNNAERRVWQQERNLRAALRQE
ncbi:MAG TPA: thioredoxin family protein [Oxalicibacterium sp.]|nr:thioredoxin family protein [Oxalicibacterium sp.]